MHTPIPISNVLLSDCACACVWLVDDPGKGARPVHISMLGCDPIEEAADALPGGASSAGRGLWPSDHFGLVCTISMAMAEAAVPPTQQQRREDTGVNPMTLDAEQLRVSPVAEVGTAGKELETTLKRSAECVPVVSSTELRARTLISDNDSAREEGRGPLWEWAHQKDSRQGRGRRAVSGERSGEGGDGGVATCVGCGSKNRALDVRLSATLLLFLLC